MPNRWEKYLLTFTDAFFLLVRVKQQPCQEVKYIGKWLIIYIMSMGYNRERLKKGRGTSRNACTQKMNCSLLCTGVESGCRYGRDARHQDNDMRFFSRS